MAWQTPKTDWVANPIKPRSQDFNRIEGNIAYLKDEIETKKGAIVDALNTMNQSATIENSYQELANKIKDISKDANASVSQVLTGRTFYQGGVKRTGTMPNIGALVITPGKTDQSIPMGYHNGLGKVLGVDWKKWASGVISNNPNSGLVVTGLPFKPSAVMIYNSYFSNPYYYVRQILLQAGAGVSHYKIVHTYRLNVNTQTIDQIGGSVLSNGIVVTDDGFSVDNGALMTGTGRTVNWIAYE